jgi:putative membrane protein
MLGVAALAAMFGTASAYAQTAPQTAPDASGQTPANKAGSMSPQGQNETSSVKPKTDAKSGSSSASDTAGSSASGKASGSLSKSDQKMMKDLAQANMAEIEAAKVAQQKSSDEKVKNFAQKMIDDHTKAGEQMQQLAQAKGVTLPTEVDAKHKAEIKKLSALSGDKFDKAYMARGGVQDHRQAHALLGKIEKSAKDSDLKQLASGMMPTVDEHWKMAKDMRSEQTSATGSSGNKSRSKSGKAEKSSGASSSSSSGASGMDTKTDSSGKTEANRAGEMSTTGQNETSSVKPTGEPPSSAPGTTK